MELAATKKHLKGILDFRLQNQRLWQQHFRLNHTTEGTLCSEDNTFVPVKKEPWVGNLEK